MEMFLGLSLIERFFCYSAGFGSMFFVIRMITMLMGFMSSGGGALISDQSASSVDLDGDGIPDALEVGGNASSMIDADGNGIPDVMESGNSSLLLDSDGDGVPDILENDNQLPEKVPLLKKFLSLQSLSAFFMMLGWVGLAMMKSSGFGPVPAVLAGSAAGVATASALTAMNDWLMGLRSCGNARLVTAKGQVGRVYLRIPAGDSGQVEVEVDGRLKICDAVSANENEAIDSDTKVLVVDVKDLNTLIVTPYKN